MLHHRIALLALVAVALTLPVLAQQSDKQDKPLDVRSSVGDLHVGKDADAQAAGLPLYPGARSKHEDNNDPLNFALLTESLGLKLVVAKYESDDPAAKIIAYYRDKMKKYGKVLECHSHDEKGHAGVHVDSDSDDQHSNELKCEGDNAGPVTELKVGTSDNQHDVAIEPGDSRKVTTFTIVYVNGHKKGEL